MARALFKRLPIAAALSALGILGFTASPALAAAPAADAAAGTQKESPRAQEASTIRLAAQAEAPTSSTAPLMIYLAPDEKACRKLYGDDWAVRCSVNLGRYGAEAAGVKLTPAVAGRWQWYGPSTLAFIPEKAWPAGKKFRVSLANLAMPLRVRLAASGLDVETPPLTANASRSEFWLDPAVDGMRYLSFDYQFTTAPDRATIEKNFAVDTSKCEGLRLEKPEFIWNAAGDGVFVKVKVLALPKTAGAVRATIKGVAAKFDEKNGRFTVPKGFETAGLDLSLPGIDTLFRVESARVSSVRDEKLDLEYEAVLRTTLSIAPEKLLEALEVYALPAKLSDAQASETDWRQAPVIDDEVLSRAKRIDVRAADAAITIPTNEIKIRLKAPAGTFLYWKLPKGFGPGETFALNEDWRTVLLLPAANATLNFLQPGNVLTMAGTRKLSVAATGLEKIRWRVARVKDDFLALASTGFRVLSNPSADNLVEAGSGTIELGALSPATAATARFTTIDLEKSLADMGAGIFQVTLEGVRTDKEKGVERTVVTAMKKVLVTNTALIVKRAADTSIDVFAADFATGEPAAGRTAELLAANGTVIETVQTDANGRAHFRPTAGLTRERLPVAVAVKSTAEAANGQKGSNPPFSAKLKDLAWLSLADQSNVSPLMRFDAAGRRTDGAGEEALAALVFADRGVYRSGETVHFAAVLKRADGKPVSAGMPVTLRVSDDAGRTLETKTVEAPADGLLSLDWQIPRTQLPGRIRCDAALPGSDTVIASTTVVLEDFAPETLALEAELPKDKRDAAWLAPEDITLETQLTSLYGAGATGRRIEGRLLVTPLLGLTFPDWKDYTFEAPGRIAGTTYLGSPESRDLDAARTDAKGTAAVTLPLAETPIEGWAQAQVSLEGFEAEGGRAVTESLSFIVSRAETALGWRLIDTPQPLTGLRAGKAATMEMLLIDRSAEPVANAQLSVSFAKRRYVTELATDASGKPVYRDRPVSEAVSETAVETDPNGRLMLPLETEHPGDWLLTVRDTSGTVLAAIPYHAAGNEPRAGLSAALPSAEVRASTDRSAYEAGEKIAVSILSPFEGFGLLTLEADGVERAHWIKVRTGQNAADFEVPENFAGKGYLRLSLVRGQKDAGNYLGGYAEAVMPVTLNRRTHALGLTLEAPETNASPAAVPVTIKSETPARVFLWAVDDGILSLTNFRTPDPMRAILEDRALEVETRQVLDKLMPDASALGTLLPPFGGDFESAKIAAGSAMNNPFSRTAEASAVWWGGLVDVGPDPKTVMMTLPSGFNGKVRVMAAGASETRIGSVSRETVVRAPLALDAMLPRAVAPGDRFRMAALVTPKDPIEGATGTLAITTPPAFGLSRVEFPLEFLDEGGARISGDFTAPKYPMTAAITFDARVNPEARADAAAGTQSNETQKTEEKPGEALHAERTIELSVRPAAILKTTLSGGRFGEAPAKTKATAKAAADKTATSQAAAAAVQAVATLAPDVRTLSLKGALYPFDEETALTVSRRPTALVANLADQFEPSPWALADETIAAALPLAYLASNPSDRAAYAAIFAGPEAKDAATLERFEEKILRDAQDKQAKALKAIRESLGHDGMRVFPWLEGNLFLTAWTADYLLSVASGDTAEALGGVPPELMRDVARRLRGLVEREPMTLDEARSCAYALWVLAREGTIVTGRMASLKALLEERFPEWKNDSTAVFLAGAAMTMRMRDEAMAFLEAGGGRISTARAGGDWSPELAAAMTSTVFAQPDFRIHPRANFWKELMLEDLRAALSGGPLSPVYAAAAARAVVLNTNPLAEAATAPTTTTTTTAAAGTAASTEQTSAAAAAPAMPELVCTERAKGFRGKADVFTKTTDAVKLVAPGCLAFEVRGPEGVALDDWFWSLRRQGYAVDPAEKPVRNGLSVSRRYLNAQGEAVDRFQTGELVTVSITLRGTAAQGPTRFTDVAVTDLLPGGFELADGPGVGPEGALSFMRAEDRMRFVAREVTADETTYVYRVRAVTPGVFTAPAVEAQSVSRPAVSGAGVASRITIEDALE